MAKTMNCFSLFRLTTLWHWRKNGEKHSPVSLLPVLVVSRFGPHVTVIPCFMAIHSSASEHETLVFARDWARQLQPNDVVALVGDLGAGKTHFVKGMLQGLASTDAVTSPTFTLVHEYGRGR